MDDHSRDLLLSYGITGGATSRSVKITGKTGYDLLANIKYTGGCNIELLGGFDSDSDSEVEGGYESDDAMMRDRDDVSTAKSHAMVPRDTAGAKNPPSPTATTKNEDINLYTTQQGKDNIFEFTVPLRCNKSTDSKSTDSESTDSESTDSESVNSMVE
jgi:hypothetical protein